MMVSEQNVRVNFRQVLPIHRDCVWIDAESSLCCRSEVLEVRLIDGSTKGED
eukprot:COSAG02_NODE_5209_length_4540_cov_13.058771_6_plen_52_part_00